MKLGVSEAAKWGDRLVSGAPQPLNGLLRERSGVMVGEKGGEDITTITEEIAFFA